MMSANATQDDLVKHAASLWVLLQDNPDDPEFSAHIDRWRQADPSHDAAWQEVCDLDQLFNQLQPTAPLPRPQPRIRQRHFAPTPQPKRRRGLMIGLATAAAISLAVYLGPDVFTQFQADEFTGRSETRAVALADGSTVHLGADSAITVDLSTSERHISLLKGEAFFEVAHEPSRPFRVTSGSVSATALGTSFLVQNFDEDDEVLVSTGTVLVRKDASTSAGQTLSPGQWARADTNGDIKTGQRAPEAATAFLHDRLVAMDQPVAHALQSLQRNFNGKVIILPADLKGKNITGVYDVTRPVAAARAMVQPFDGSVWMLSNWVMVVSL